MIYLLVVSFLWAFSFGLIKENLSGLDSNFVAFIRMLIAFLVFAPFMRLTKISPGLSIKLVAIGGIQFGLMYITYIYSYGFLLAHQVALYTIFTPLYVTLINDLWDRRIRIRMLFTSLLAILGAFIIMRVSFHQIEIKTGFLILQVSNICFAFGQVAYKRLMHKHPGIKDQQIFGLLYFGALAITAIGAAMTTNWTGLELGWTQCWTLLYLGVLASGLCFFLWNFGARKTNTGALAILNNLKIPLAVACSLLFFHEKGHIPSLALGGGIILVALFLNEYFIRGKKAVRS